MRLDLGGVATSRTEKFHIGLDRGNGSSVPLTRVDSEADEESGAMNLSSRRSQTAEEDRRAVVRALGNVRASSHRPAYRDDIPPRYVLHDFNSLKDASTSVIHISSIPVVQLDPSRCHTQAMVDQPPPIVFSALIPHDANQTFRCARVRFTSIPHWHLSARTTCRGG